MWSNSGRAALCAFCSVREIWAMIAAAHLQVLHGCPGPRASAHWSWFWRERPRSKPTSKSQGDTGRCGLRPRRQEEDVILTSLAS